jgi:hypothetical protein
VTRLFIWWLHRRHIRFQQLMTSGSTSVQLAGGPWCGHQIKERVSWLEFPSRPDCLCSGRVLACYAWDGRVMRFAGWLSKKEVECRQGVSGKRGE